MTASATPSTAVKHPGLLKLGASLVYEALVVIALCFASALIYISVMGNATQGFKRYLLQLFLWFAVGVYYVRCWSVSGQTLAMHTWRIQLIDRAHTLISLRVAALRYVLATLSLALLGVGFLWALIDHDGLFLHDRILKLSIQTLPKTPPTR